MKPIEKQTLKRLLEADDDSSLAQKLPHCNQQEIAKVIDLLIRYRIAKKDHKDAQSDTREISKKIGEAKKQGVSTDPLIREMQTKSAETKNIGAQLQELEVELGNYLVHQRETTKVTHEHEQNPGGRRYPDTALTGPITLSLLNDETESWNRYVETNPATSLYHLAQWRELIRDTFGHKSLYFFAHDANRNIKGILPLVRLKSHLFGDFCVSMPYFNYGGAIADHPAIEEQLIQHANSYAAEQGVSHVEYRDDIPKPDTPVRTDKVNMILALPASQDELWQSFTPKVRAQIKRPQRENPQVLHGGMEYLPEFYAVFAQNMRDLGTPVYGKIFFKNILDRFPDQSSIMIIKLDGKPVAAAFLLGYRDTLEIPWASTIRNVSHLSVNMLMYWKILCFAISKKYSYFDFGRSSIESGTYKFKKQWGAQPKQLYWHYWLKSGSLPALNPANPKYALIINIWKRLPIFITRLIGPAIVKNLP